MKEHCLLELIVHHMKNIVGSCITAAACLQRQVSVSLVLHECSQLADFALGSFLAAVMLQQ